MDARSLKLSASSHGGKIALKARGQCIRLIGFDPTGRPIWRPCSPQERR